MLCLEYTLTHNQKKNNNYIPQIHVHLELAQSITYAIEDQVKLAENAINHSNLALFIFLMVLPCLA